MTKYIFVTGGVVSSLGKGLTSAAIGWILERHGFKVSMQKLDPYINVDPGTMSPFQHLSPIHISEPTRLTPISYAVFRLKKKNKQSQNTTPSRRRLLLPPSSYRLPSYPPLSCPHSLLSCICVR